MSFINGQKSGNFIFPWCKSIATISLLASSAFAFEAERPQFPEELLLGTQTDSVVHVEGAEVALLNEAALKRDYPALANYSTEALKELVLKNYALISKTQIMLNKVRYTVEDNGSIPVVEGTSNTAEGISAFRPRFYNRAACIAVREFKLFLLELKGLGLTANSDAEYQLGKYELALKSETPEKALTQLQRRDHSDGMMSLGEALAEAARQYATQILFEAYNQTHGTNYQTIETYFVIRLPLRLLKGMGESIPAGLYARQAHWGRRYHFDPPEGTIDGKAGHIQQSFLGAVVDWGGIFVHAPEFFKTFLEGGSLSDPQYSKIWGEAHDVARQIEAGDKDAAERWFKRLFGSAYPGSPRAVHSTQKPHVQSLGEELAEIHETREEDFQKIFKFALRIWKMSSEERSLQFSVLTPSQQKRLPGLLMMSELNQFDALSDLVSIADQELLEEIVKIASQVDASGLMLAHAESYSHLVLKAFKRGKEIITNWPDSLIYNFMSCHSGPDAPILRQTPEFTELVVSLIPTGTAQLEKQKSHLHYLIENFADFTEPLQQSIFEVFGRNYRNLPVETRAEFVKAIVPIFAEDIQREFPEFGQNALHDQVPYIRALALLSLDITDDILQALALAWEGKTEAEDSSTLALSPVNAHAALQNLESALHHPSGYIRGKALQILQLNIDQFYPSGNESFLDLLLGVLNSSADDRFIGSIYYNISILEDLDPTQSERIRTSLASLLQNSKNPVVIEIAVSGLLNRDHPKVSSILLKKIEEELAAKGGWRKLIETGSDHFGIYLRWLIYILEKHLRGLGKGLETGDDTDRIRKLLRSREVTEYLLSQSAEKIEDTDSLKKSYSSLASIFNILRIENTFRLLGRTKKKMVLSPKVTDRILRRVEAIGNASHFTLEHHLNTSHAEHDALVKYLSVTPDFRMRRKVMRYFVRTSIFSPFRNTRRDVEDQLWPSALEDSSNLATFTTGLQSTDEQIRLRTLRMITRLSTQAFLAEDLNWIRHLRPLVEQLTYGDSTVAEFAKVTLAELEKACSKCEALLGG